MLLYVGVFGTFALLADSARIDLDLRLLDAVAAAATLGNVGPGLGFAGPMGSFDPFSDASKLVMIVLMWLGRLEIIPVAVLLSAIAGGSRGLAGPRGSGLALRQRAEGASMLQCRT